MRVAEVFYSIQGEGELTGVPSVFVRTSGCNLRCRWCDTKYALGGDGEDLGVDDIVAEVEQYPTRFCVLTGGEPTIAKGIGNLAGRLVGLRKHVTIETAATVPPDGIACSLASLSPKLSNSTPDDGVGEDWARKHEERRLQPDVIRTWIDQYAYQLKFVVSGPADVQEVLELLETLRRDVPPEKVLLMPEGIEQEVLRDRAGLVIEVCKQHGFRFCNRLHVELWGNTKGR